MRVQRVCHMSRGRSHAEKLIYICLRARACPRKLVVRACLRACRRTREAARLFEHGTRPSRFTPLSACVSLYFLFTFAPSRTRYFCSSHWLSEEKIYTLYMHVRLCHPAASLAESYNILTVEFFTLWLYPQPLLLPRAAHAAALHAGAPRPKMTLSIFARALFKNSALRVGQVSPPRRRLLLLLLCCYCCCCCC